MRQTIMRRHSKMEFSVLNIVNWIPGMFLSNFIFWLHNICSQLKIGKHTFSNTCIISTWHKCHSCYICWLTEVDYNFFISNQAFQWIFCTWVINCLCKEIFSKTAQVIYWSTLSFLGGLYNFCKFVIIFSLM